MFGPTSRVANIRKNRRAILLVCSLIARVILRDGGVVLVEFIFCSFKRTLFKRGVVSLFALFVQEMFAKIKHTCITNFHPVCLPLNFTDDYNFIIL